MKINIYKKSTNIPPPSATEVCILAKKKYPEEIHVVFFVPGPHPQFLFVRRGNSYLPQEAWEQHVNTYYDHIGTFPQSKVEIHINA